MIIKIPPQTLVVLCGPAGCGKSTFARQNFLETQIVSTDRCRALVSDDEENMAVSGQAFKLFHLIIDMRLANGKLAVADSTALTRTARKRLLKLAQKYSYHTAALVFDMPLEHCLKQNLSRTRNVEPDVIREHTQALKKTVSEIPGEPFNQLYILKAADIRETSVVITERGC